MGNRVELRMRSLPRQGPRDPVGCSTEANSLLRRRDGLGRDVSRAGRRDAASVLRVTEVAYDARSRTLARAAATMLA